MVRVQLRLEYNKGQGIVRVRVQLGLAKSKRCQKTGALVLQESIVGYGYIIIIITIKNIAIITWLSMVMVISSSGQTGCFCN